MIIQIIISFISVVLLAIMIMSQNRSIRTSELEYIAKIKKLEQLEMCSNLPEDSKNSKDQNNNC